MSVLLYYRQFHGLSEEEIAERLSVSVDEYKMLEAGSGNVDRTTALKLSKVYSAPPQIFQLGKTIINMTVVFSNCNFENSCGYVNHLYSG